jgi:hypothetical protein
VSKAAGGGGNGFGGVKSFCKLVILSFLSFCRSQKETMGGSKADLALIAMNGGVL